MPEKPNGFRNEMTSSGTEENFINTSRYTLGLGEIMVNISG
jgi:hypothetical protein